ncbi:MAG: cytochrome c oxidase subunit II [Deltaproteobacteria bacterium]|nr:MAG: cytochrome c oxidase subunit II [Deltaproteobacteria bacterium]
MPTGPVRAYWVGRWREGRTSAWGSRVRPAILLAVTLGAVAVASAGDDTTRTSSVFAPVSGPADAVYRVATLALAITGAIFVVVGGLLAYSVVRFRRRPDDDGTEPAQVYGSEQVELAWTVIPILVVIVLCLVTARTVYDVQGAQKPAGAIDVTIVGHQWWWEVRYPALGIVTANELHVPVSDSADPTPTFMALESADVAHSFWVPRLAGKTDLIPNRTNHMWIEPRETGLFLGQCAEYCGTQHAHMLLRVYVQPRAEFDRWVVAQRRPAAADPAAADGRRVFEATACVNCHTVRGTVATGRFGPDLTHLMSRATLVAGAAPMTRASLHAWIDDPDRVKPGALMPAMKLDAPALDQLVGYLATLE